MDKIKKDLFISMHDYSRDIMLSKTQEQIELKVTNNNANNDNNVMYLKGVTGNAFLLN